MTPSATQVTLSSLTHKVEILKVLLCTVLLSREDIRTFFLTHFSLLSPSESPDEEGSGIVEEGSGVLSVTTVTQSPEVFFRRTTTESEAVGEVETQQPTIVDYTEAPTEVPLPQPPNVTELITELIKSVTAQPDVGREPSKSFVMPPTGQ